MQSQFFRYNAKTGRVDRIDADGNVICKENRHHFVQPDTPDYVSPVTGLLVSGRKQRNADLKNTNSREWAGMEQEQKEAARQRQYAEQKMEREIFRSAEKAIMQLPENLRRQLAG